MLWLSFLIFLFWDWCLIMRCTKSSYGEFTENLFVLKCMINFYKISKHFHFIHTINLLNMAIWILWKKFKWLCYLNFFFCLFVCYVSMTSSVVILFIAMEIRIWVFVSWIMWPGAGFYSFGEISFSSWKIRMMSSKISERLPTVNSLYFHYFSLYFSYFYFTYFIILKHIIKYLCFNFLFICTTHCLGFPGGAKW